MNKIILMKIKTLFVTKVILLFFLFFNQLALANAMGTDFDCGSFSDFHGQVVQIESKYQNNPLFKNNENRTTLYQLAHFEHLIQSFEQVPKEDISQWEDCYIIASTDLLSSLFSNEKQYAHWFKFLGERFYSADEKRFSLGENSLLHIFFVQAENMWYHNMNAILDWKFFEENWPYFQIKVSLFFGGIIAAAFPKKGFKRNMKFSRSFSSKLIRNPQLRRVILTRGLPMSSTLGVSNKVGDEESFQTKVSRLNDKELKELLTSPANIINDYLATTSIKYIWTEIKKPVSLTYLRVTRSLYTKILSFAGGIAGGMIADSLVAGSIPYIIKHKPFDRILFHENEVDKPKNKVKRSMKTKALRFYVKAKKSLKPKKILKSTKDWVKFNWLSFSVSLGTAIWATEFLNNKISEYYSRNKRDEFVEGFEKIISNIKASTDRLTRFNLTNGLINNYLSQYRNSLALPFLIKRVELADQIFQQLQPSIFCYKYHGRKFTELAENNIDTILTKDGEAEVLKLLNEKKNKVSLEVRDLIEKERDEIVFFLDYHSEKISQLLNSENIANDRYFWTQVKSFKKFFETFLNFDAQLEKFKTTLLLHVTSEAHKISLIDDKRLIRQFYKKGLIDSKKEKIFCEPYKAL